MTQDGLNGDALSVELKISFKVESQQLISHSKEQIELTAAAKFYFVQHEKDTSPVIISLSQQKFH